MASAKYLNPELETNAKWRYTRNLGQEKIVENT